MKFLRWQVNAQKAPKPLPAELVTALALLADYEERLTQIEENVKLTRSRLETVYRKVYRDEEAARDGDKNPELLTQLIAQRGASVAKEIKPGDPPE